MDQDPSPSLSTHPTNPQPSTRRVPPPCWTDDETLALIESYHEKWYSLGRGNLKTPHWDEVADAVARRCNLVTPSKTSVQCRHKLEKLRKRYRSEKQRALTAPNRFSSSWILFKRMDAMEKGPSSTGDSDENAEEDDDDDEHEDDGERYDLDEHNISISNTRNFHRPMTNGGSGSSRGGGGGGFRFRIPSGQQQQQQQQRLAPNFTFAKPKNYGRFDENPNPTFIPNPISSPSPNLRFMNGSSWTKSGSERSSGGKRGKPEMDPIAEMVSSIRLLGEGFVKMEQMKIEMTREVEKMRMEMEMKRTEMILESQQRIVDAFAKGFSAKKKVKRMSSPQDS
ncbi:MADF domain [Macleaya cordata]|uniref:MADF domain n=1 Tax=Macleaya cordata TaxID=56857 RepID=A0A200RAW9_MACCD|nr:MADF domain [Macleaya cordata]